MKRPFIYVNMAMTADGKITSAAREHPRFASRVDRANMDRLRAAADAVLIGAGTLRADDPPLHVRDADALAARRAAGRPDDLWYVLLSASLSVDPTHHFFTNPRCLGRIIATVDRAPAARRTRLAGSAEIWTLGAATVDLPQLVARLATEKKIERLLVEGGAETNWAFFAAGLVDELYLTICPTLLGGGAAPTPLAGPGFGMQQRLRLDLLEARPIEGEIFCRYAVRGSAPFESP